MMAVLTGGQVRDQRGSLRKQGWLKMLAEAHRQAAEDIEKTILPLQATSYAARVVIEGAWGAKPSTRATRRAMRAWGLSFAVREKVRLPMGGRIWTAFGRGDGTAGRP